MKPKKTFTASMVDRFLPKHREGWSIIQHYRSRALIASCLIGAVTNPLVILIHGPQNSPQVIIIMTVAIMLTPLLIVWAFYATGQHVLCTFTYLVYCVSTVSWAMLTAATPHALYWIWYPFNIIHGSLLLGRKKGGWFACFVIILAWGTMSWNIQAGSTLGRFENFSTMIRSYYGQILVSQFYFLLNMLAYDGIRNRSEVRAVMLRISSEEAERLANVGQKMAEMSSHMHEKLASLQGEVLKMDVQTKRSDTKVEDLQKLATEVQQKVAHLRNISQGVHTLPSSVERGSELSGAKHHPKGA